MALAAAHRLRAIPLQRGRGRSLRPHPGATSFRRGALAIRMGALHRRGPPGHPRHPYLRSTTRHPCDLPGRRHRVLRQSVRRPAAQPTGTSPGAGAGMVVGVPARLRRCSGRHRAGRHPRRGADGVGGFGVGSPGRGLRRVLHELGRSKLRGRDHTPAGSPRSRRHRVRPRRAHVGRVPGRGRARLRSVRTGRRLAGHLHVARGS